MTHPFVTTVSADGYVQYTYVHKTKEEAIRWIERRGMKTPDNWNWQIFEVKTNGDSTISVAEVPL